MRTHHLTSTDRTTHIYKSFRQEERARGSNSKINAMNLIRKKLRNKTGGSTTSTSSRAGTAPRPSNGYRCSTNSFPSSTSNYDVSMVNSRDRDSQPFEAKDGTAYASRPGVTDLHKACFPCHSFSSKDVGSLIIQERSTVREPDFMGRLPLHITVNSICQGKIRISAGIEAIDFLVIAFLQAIHHKDGNYKTPLNIVQDATDLLDAEKKNKGLFARRRYQQKRKDLNMLASHLKRIIFHANREHIKERNRVRLSETSYVLSDLEDTPKDAFVQVALGDGTSDIGSRSSSCSNLSDEDDEELF